MNGKRERRALFVSPAAKFLADGVQQEIKPPEQATKERIGGTWRHGDENDGTCRR